MWKCWHQVQALCESVTAAPPAPGAEQDAFFAQPAHILARMVRDVLTTGDVAETLKDIMPAIVQVRAATRPPLLPKKCRQAQLAPVMARPSHARASTGYLDVTPHG